MFWVLVTVAAVGLFWVGYRHPIRRRWLLPRRAVVRAPASVDSQHRHLAAGGRCAESAVAGTAARFGELLRTGRAAEVERELRPGVGFAVQVRALAAVGTPEAGRVLERQLSRTVTRDPVEQAWYWADIAAGLRHLHHVPALAAVLRCADAAEGLPAGPVLAAEAVAFPNFPTSLNDLSSPVGRSALKALAVAARGCRGGSIDPECMLRAGLGDLLATLSETAPPVSDPWLTAVVVEAERIARRAPHWVRLVPEDVRQASRRQAARLAAATGRRKDWLAGGGVRLVAQFPHAGPAERAATLRCAFDLRADVTSLFPHLPDRRAPWWADAICCLTWSRSPSAGPVLAVEAVRWLRTRRGADRAASLLAALRGHACIDSERTLLFAAESQDRRTAAAAVGSLGWWSPLIPEAVVGVLRLLRNDRDISIRTAAVSALARLGERAALDEVAAGLTAEEPALRVATVARVAAEGLSWLWPDVQLLADTGDGEVALAAVEASERLREQVMGVIG